MALFCRPLGMSWQMRLGTVNEFEAFAIMTVTNNLENFGASPKFSRPWWKVPGWWKAPGDGRANLGDHRGRDRLGGPVRYLIVAEAYRDLEQVSSRLALTERLAALLAQTPPGLLPTVCYLCQGLIAPEFAGVDLGLAEKLAVRAVATAVGTDAAQVAALVRETGDLGQAAERLLAVPCDGTGSRAADL